MVREFPTLKRTSVSLEAAEAIKALIVSGELGSGDALPPERNLAAMLGISRPSVREALRVLTAMNVVEPRHGGGTYVTSLDPTLLAQPINFLLQVEPAHVPPPVRGAPGARGVRRPVGGAEDDR